VPPYATRCGQPKEKLNKNRLQQQNETLTKTMAFYMCGCAVCARRPTLDGAGRADQEEKHTPKHKVMSKALNFKHNTQDHKQNYLKNIRPLGEDFVECVPSVAHAV
jgi:hypothetical protein